MDDQSSHGHHLIIAIRTARQTLRSLHTDQLDLDLIRAVQRLAIVCRATTDDSNRDLRGLLMRGHAVDVPHLPGVRTRSGGQQSDILQGSSFFGEVWTEESVYCIRRRNV